ncbi:hypothetical protein [Clostridium beijerinckii]|nr:hypothetical protein [Clostridium beijerinckii]
MDNVTNKPFIKLEQSIKKEDILCKIDHLNITIDITSPCNGILTNIL